MKPLRDRFASRFLVLAAILPLAGVAWLPDFNTGPENPSTAAVAQPPATDPRPWKPEELDSLVAPIALYPTRCWRRSWRLPPIPWSWWKPSNG